MTEQRLDPIEYVGYMRDELALDPVIVEVGEGGPESEVWKIWPEDADADDEDDITYIRGQVEQYLEFLETGPMDPDEVVYDDLAKLIALKVILYEELVAEGVDDYVEQEKNEALLNFYRSFFESRERLEEMLWAYANGQSENYFQKMETGKCGRWARIRAVFGRVIGERKIDMGE